MAAKKSFKNENPAMQFISQPVDSREAAPPVLESPAPRPVAEQAERAVTPDSDAPMKLNPLYIETRSRRLNLLIQPSLHTKIKRLASARNTSVNDLIHIILEEYAEREG